jgi:large subunit ribosomal protein L5
MVPRLKKAYTERIAPNLQTELGAKNPLQVPRLTKVVLNMGLGEAIQNVKVLDSAASEMAAITGQKPVITKSRKAIANFKLREDVPIGAMVTLRGARMYEFLDRLLNVALPRVRDFKGVSDKGFDGRGNYSLGITEQIIFPEIDIDKIDKVKGLTVTIVTTAKSDSEGKALLRALGMPFRS